jgi:hypothetical protein
LIASVVAMAAGFALAVHVDDTASVSDVPAQSSPGPQSAAAESLSAAQLAAVLRGSPNALMGCSIPFGLSPYGATGDLQCTFDGKFVRLLSFDGSVRTPTSVPGLQDRTVVFGPSWIVIASDLAQAQTIQQLVGGRVFLTPVLTSAQAFQHGPRRNCAAGCTVRYVVDVQNPMDRSAMLFRHAKAASTNHKVLFRQAGSDGLRRMLGPDAAARLDAVAHTDRPGTLAEINAWCVARPLVQPS